MNIKSRLLMGVFYFLFTACTISSSNAYAALAYVKASSFSDQFPTHGPDIVQIEHLDLISKIDYREEKKFIIQEAGVYHVIATAQPGINVIAPVGYVDVWLERNGIPVTSSSARMVVDNRKATGSLVIQTLLDLKKNDSIAVGFSSSNQAIGLISIDSTSPNQPVIPSVTISMFSTK